MIVGVEGGVGASSANSDFNLGEQWKAVGGQDDRLYCVEQDMLSMRDMRGRSGSAMLSERDGKEVCLIEEKSWDSLSDMSRYGGSNGGMS